MPASTGPTGEVDESRLGLSGHLGHPGNLGQLGVRAPTCGAVAPIDGDRRDAGRRWPVAPTTSVPVRPTIR
jgi:hypothetical protein